LRNSRVTITVGPDRVLGVPTDRRSERILQRRKERCGMDSNGLP
jgi:hypothetical protein